MARALSTLCRSPVCSFAFGFLFAALARRYRQSPVYFHLFNGTMLQLHLLHFPLFFFDLLIDDPSKQYRYFSLRFFVNFSNLHQSPNVSSNSLNYFQPRSFPSASVPHAGLVCQEEISALSSMLHHPSPKNLQDRPRRLWRRKQT